ncbi:MAG: hypothetical protein J0H57_05925, partial [Rhodospirillales bacterium]|nr:hypothetical protein [Rhodospirillales bacterium]
MLLDMRDNWVPRDAMARQQSAKTNRWWRAVFFRHDVHAGLRTAMMPASSVPGRIVVLQFQTGIQTTRAEVAGFMPRR